MAQNLIKWIKTTAAKYAGLEVKDANALYFLEDTGEIYKGEISFTSSVIVLGPDADFPATGAKGKIYVNATGVCKSWDGTKWNIVNAGFSTTLTDEATVNVPVSGEAIKTYVATKFQESVTGNFVNGITYDKATKALKYTKVGSEEATSVPVEGFVTGASYNGENGSLSFTVAGGEAISINLPKDNFVSNGTYNPDTHEIILTLAQGGEVKIPAADLVDTYTAEATSSVNLTVSDNKFKAEVKVSAEGGNQLSVKDDGLFVAATDISGKLDKVAGNKQGKLIVAKADGQVEASEVSVGGATLAGEPNATTVATEAAVAHAKSEALDAANQKLAKSAVIDTEHLAGDQVVTPDDAHVYSAAATNKKIGDAVKAESDKLNGSLIAKDAISTAIPVEGASDEKVVSEKLLADTKTGLTNDINGKVSKGDVVHTIGEQPSEEKVVSEKAVAAAKEEILAAISWNVL